MSFYTKLSVFATCLILGSFSLYNTAFAESLQERIKPVGETCMAGDACAAASSGAAANSEPRSGEAVYSTKCFICHATGAANAPKVGDVANWSQRLAARKLDGMYNSALNGFNGMPPKGTCGDCSDDEIKAAVDHMLAKSK